MANFVGKRIYSNESTNQFKLQIGITLTTITMLIIVIITTMPIVILSLST